MSEIIYILTNEAMQGYIKIGMTHNSLEHRMKQLDRTNIPLPFECYHACEVDNAADVEKWLHSVFSDRRVRDEREFFKIDPERVVAAVRRIELKDITPKSLTYVSRDEETAIEEAKNIRSRFDFEHYGIGVNSILEFSRDHSVKARVLTNNRIEVNGENTSLSASAKTLLGYKNAVAGTLYWTYEGETLDERRRRIDSQE